MDKREPITDSFGRRITYLRASVTDLCNMRCVYCAPRDMKFLPMSEILTLEEIARVVGVAVSAGVTKVRLTGGEPLARPNVIKLVRDVAAIPGLEDLSLTTNGLLLEEFAEPLKQAGLHRINVSLDTLEPEKFKTICRRGDIGAVLRGIDAAVAAGLLPVKINVVAMRGTNDSEIEAFARFSLQKGVTVRFIEYMPMGNGAGPDDKFISRNDIMKRLGDFITEPGMPPENPCDPARYYSLNGGSAFIGIISPVSHGFCSNCNRMRLTPEGALRGCLLSEERVDIKKLLRSGASDDDIANAFRRAAAQKGEKGEFGNMDSPMHRIGG